MSAILRRDGTTLATRRADGRILWAGPSVMDGSQIVAVLTGLRARSENAKTGPMAQLWILPAGQDPVAAVRYGADSAVCGTCPLRPSARGGCYVRTEQAPLSVWRAWRRGAYAHAGAYASRRRILAGRRVRVGAYGDPGALPDYVVRWIASAAAGWTGYTHAWRQRPDLRPYVMASVESHQDAVDARLAGWRAFRVVRSPAVPAMDREIPCPAPRVTCHDCGACCGLARPTAPSISVVAHGAHANRVVLV